MTPSVASNMLTEKATEMLFHVVYISFRSISKQIELQRILLYREISTSSPLN